MTTPPPAQHLAPLADQEFLRCFNALSQIGATPGGGVDRQAGTEADHAARRWFDEWLRERGFATRLDAIGNQFGLFELVPDAPWVLVGSHLDSQPLAGRFDGAYGVLAGAWAAARAVEEVHLGRVRATHNIAVVNWFNEEGCRFSPSMMGSAVFTGALPLRAALETKDTTGTSVRAALSASHAPLGDYRPTPLGCYAEIHVEQGRELESQGLTIGLVAQTWAARKFHVTVSGEQSHTGSTAMADRRDALYGAALLIAATRELTERREPGQLHTAVSQVSVEPNSPVVIAREVRMNLDLRSPSEQLLEEAVHALHVDSGRIAERARVEINLELSHAWGLMDYSEAGLSLARRVATESGLPHTEMMTIAGHDSTNLKELTPTVMLFVPSVQGISHNERECTSDKDLVDGLAMLSALAVELIGGALTEPSEP